MPGLASSSARSIQPRRWYAAFAVAAALLCASAAQSQSQSQALRRDFYFRTIGTEQGLAQNTVSAFLQDRDGYLWIGTDSGLQQYDGYDFTTFAHASDDPASLPEGPISSLAQDADGNLWIGTLGSGLVRHRPHDEGFEHIGTFTNIHTLRVDPRSGLWVGCDSGILLLDPRSGAVLQQWPLGAAGERTVQLRQFDVESEHEVWAASSSGLLRLSRGAAAPVRVAATQIADARALLTGFDGRLRVATSDGLYVVDENGSARRIWPDSGDQPVTAMVEDPRGRLWLGVQGVGLALFDPRSGETQWLRPDAGVPGSLPDAIITSLQFDRSGLLWLGTHERGISKVDPAGTAFRYVADRDPSRRPTAANYIRAVFEDGSGDLWVGTPEGIKRYRQHDNRFDYFDDLVLHGIKGEQSARDLTVYGFAQADSGRLWIGSDRGAALFDPVRRTLEFLPVDPRGTHGLIDGNIRALLVADDGAVWFGSTRAGVARFDPRDGSWTHYRRDAGDGAIDGLSDNRVLTLYQDREHRIWAGNINGLNLIDPVQRSVRVFRSDPQDAHSLSATLVRSIHQSTDGHLWFGTQSGLSRLDSLDESGARFSRWSVRDGLPGATVYAIRGDRMGRLWLSTNHGIASFDPTNASFRGFALADGLQGMEFNGGVATTLASGEIVFGGINGLNLFLPQAIVSSRYAAPVVLTSARVGAHGLPAQRNGDALVMAAADRLIRFEFAALDFGTPEHNRFAYQLEGFDEHWIEAGTRHDATYTNLDAGRYVFKVRASNRDGYWSEQIAQTELNVTPVWWDSFAARSVYVLGGSGLLFVLWRGQRRRRNEERSHHLDLREREDRLRLALWGSGDDFWDWDMPNDRIVLTGSGDLFRGISRRPTELNQDWFRAQAHPDDLPAVERRLEQHIARITDTFESEHRLRNKSGEWVWSLIRGKIVERDADGQPLRMCGTARDVTAERAAEHERRVAHEVIRSMGEAVAVTDLEFRFMTINPAFTRITGWRIEEISGRSAAILNCARHPVEQYLELREALGRDGHWRGELWQRRKSGEEFLSWIEVSEICDANGKRTHFVSVISDITDRKRAEQELRYLANYDALTGLPNRTLLSERIAHAIARARRNARKVAVLFLDLDRFKHVNDSMGHAAGDSMLKAAGARLRQVVREGDSVARVGGDEFTVVIEDIGSGAEAEHVAAKIIAAFEQPLELDNGQEVVISPSIGISLHPDHGQAASDLLKYADTAMYQAKDHGRKTWMVYTEAMDAAARLRATMVAALRKALERNELSLHYQPKLSLLDDRITGVEALLRWRSGDLGDISPGVFIPIAEETGMIIEIGDWVVARACAQLAQWRDAGLHDITMSINVSVAQLLRGDLIRRLCDVLAEHDIAPNQLELELTESMVMANAEQSITTLRRLKAIGVNLAIDDFGTGYSSLAHLKRLPIDALKIDKEFVGDITTDPDDEAITATVIAMAHSLGLNVIAEGVERIEQVDYLREQDCDEVQGHWLAHPLPPDQCLAFLRERATRRRSTPAEQG
ncbi:EAL domain-containing protein [Dokdonella sp.]|uniref:EAL domain-containing protein n=1 Tax=Dokdonella sp. TaxID=2291710 RepID=UPI003784347D